VCLGTGTVLQKTDDGLQLVNAANGCATLKQQVQLMLGLLAEVRELRLYETTKSRVGRMVGQIVSNPPSETDSFLGLLYGQVTLDFMDLPNATVFFLPNASESVVVVPPAKGRMGESGDQGLTANDDLDLLAWYHV
jgi:hypothetical protein